jgi:alpha-mannosidase
LFAGGDLTAARDFELGLRGVACGEDTVLAEDTPTLELSPPGLVLCALKPAEEGAGMVARVLNPTDRSLDAELRVLGERVAGNAVRLDETPEPGAEGTTVPPRALRSWLLT